MLVLIHMVHVSLANIHHLQARQKMELDYRSLGTGFCNVLHRHQSSSQPSCRRSTIGRKQHLRHHLRLPIRGLLQCGMGSYSLHSCFRNKCKHLQSLDYLHDSIDDDVQPNHVRSLVMASALMCQWAFNCVIARITPVMLNSITYGTFLIFGVCCIIMAIYTVFW